MHCLVDLLLIVSAQFNQFNLRYPVSPPTINRIEYFTRLKLTTSYNLVPRVFSKIASHDLEKQRRKDPGRSLFVLHKSSLDLGELRFDSNVSVTQCYHVLRMVVCNKLVRVYEQCFACMRQILVKVTPSDAALLLKLKKTLKDDAQKCFATNYGLVAHGILFYSPGFLRHHTQNMATFYQENYCSCSLVNI